MFVGTIYFEGSFSFINIVLIIVISSLILLREYLIVSFRITLNYKSILINNIILGLGYLFGLFLFIIFGYWQFIYITGSSLSLLYILKNTQLLKEGLVKTHFFKETTYKCFVLFLSGFMKTSLSYADRILIFPLMGPTAVTIYYTATLLGKIISMAITPISSVMLSYLTRIDKLKVNYFFNIIFIVSTLGIMGYFVTIFLSEWALKLLYPKWADESLKLIYVTTATAIIGLISSVIHPIIIRFNNINWQLIIDGLNILVYCIFVFILYEKFGLFGFTVGVLISSIFKLLLMILIYVLSSRKITDNV